MSVVFHTLPDVSIVISSCIVSLLEVLCSICSGIILKRPEHRSSDRKKIFGRSRRIVVKNTVSVSERRHP